MRDLSACRWGSVIFTTFAAALASSPVSTIGAPLILEPTATIPTPESRFPWPNDVAIDGDYIVMGTGYQYSLAPYEDYQVSAAFLYRRDNARQWTLVRKLAETDTWLWDDDVPPVQVAMRNGIAALTWYGLALQVYERSGSNWLNVPAQAELQGTELEIDGTTILASEETCGWGAEAYRKNASGIWAVVDLYEGVYRGCDGEQLGGEVDISGDIVVVPQPMSDEPGYVPVSYVWEGIPTNSPPTALGNAGPITVSGDTIAQASIRDGATGIDIYRRQSAGVWKQEQFVLQPDAMLGYSGGVQMEEGFLMHSRNGNVEMFQRDAAGQFKYVAKLLGAGDAHISQRRVVAISDEGVKVYELPTSLSQPETKQDDFQDGNANGWEAQSGSDYAVITTPYSHVYRQSSIVGNAMSLLANTDWKNQSIQADMKPTAFDGNDRWFGLIGRYVDPNNYYYVTVRNSNSVQLRKMLNGAFTTLDSAALPVSLNRTYNVRLEAIGSLLRVYVDGKMLLETHDSTHSHGRLGVMTYRTRADYDNVIVGSQQLLPLLNDREGCTPNRWQAQGEALWTDECLATGRVQVQSSTAGTARAMSGVSTTHQVIETTATATAFNGGDRWFGVMSRFVDPNNYYYLTVRSNNTVSLRRLTDGVITVLDSAPLNVAVGTPYKLRLEAIGSSLRGYVNGTLLVEAKDATFSKGRYGLVTYKTAARFESFEASQP